MANSALIEDLRKQFADNPRRVFARLANEYRKSGDLESAIEICRAHVPLQPTYISGYIVLGQALFERGQADEARSTFETALSLDPENLIALRQLGDIARAAGDLDAARGWYHKLLEVDPQNDDIAAQLEALDAPTNTTASATPAEAAPVSWSDIHPDSEVTPLSPQAMQPARPRFTIGVIPENLADDKTPVAPATTARESARAPEPPVAQNPVSTALPEYVGGFDRHSPTPPTSSPPVPSSELTLGAIEMTADTAEASLPELMDISDLAPDHAQSSDGDLPPINTTAEFALPSASTVPPAPMPPATAAALATLFAGPELETPGGVERAGSQDDESSSTRKDERPTFDEEPYDPTIGRMLDLSTRTSSDALLPDLMMTESGAELLREQGHIDQAIYVYRHLAAKNPNDSSYAERIAALQRGAHSSIPLIADISQDVISAAKNRSDSTQSIRTFFTSFATRRPRESAEGASAEPAKAPESPSSESPSSESPSIESPSSESPSSESPSRESQSSEQADASAPAAAAVDEHAALESAPQSAPEAERLAHTTSFAVPEALLAAPEAAVRTNASAPPQTVSDDDRSALESLFDANATVPATDERAAASLASAFSEEFTTESTGPAGQPTRAASDALSLDAVFQNSRARADGEPRLSQPTVSFDEFFASRDNGNGAMEGKNETAVETSPHGDDSQSDLELFHEWLDGLKK